MDSRVKNALAVVGMAALILTSVGIWQASRAFSNSAPASATFAVSGQGKAVGIPDVAQFTFSIITEGGKDVAALQKSNTEKTNAAIDYVKSQGVDKKDIETLGYNVEPRYQTYSCRPVVYTISPGSSATPAIAPVAPCPPSEIVGYTITQTIQVKARDFDKVGAILSGVATKGANNVSGLNFTVDNPSALQNEARSKAIQDAKIQAETMARAGGFRLGRLVSVNEGYTPTYYSKNLALESAAVGRGGGGDNAPAPSIEPGSQEVSSQVTLTYEIL